MVAQDSPSSEDLDDSICDIWTAKLREIFFGKTHYEISLNKTVVQKQKCHTTMQEEQQMNLHILQNTQEKRVSVENRACGMKEMMKKMLSGEN